MRVKKLALLVIVFSLVLSSGGCLFKSKNEKRRELYNRTLIGLLKEKGDQCSMKDVFNDFEWDAAYIIKEDYEGGNLLSEKLGVDITNDDIEPKRSDWVKRIAFFKDGKFVFVHEQYVHDFFFTYDSLGLIVHPDSILEYDHYWESQKTIVVKVINETEYY